MAAVEITRASSLAHAAGRVKQLLAKKVVNEWETNERILAFPYFLFVS